MSLEQLRTMIAAVNVDQAKGQLQDNRQAYTIGANDQLFKPEDYANTIIAYKNGNPVRVSDVATVIEGPENVNQAAWMNTTPAVILNIQRQPGANIIKVADSVKLRLKQLQANLPASVKITVLTDRTNTIRASVADVKFSLMLTIALVVMVIFLFLRTLAATIIPSIAVPLSLVGTFGVMYLLGYSLDNLSLMALTISTGFVVDDAIVMIENIDRYIEDGYSPLEAALRGSGQIGFTIVSLTVSLIAVLIPLLFMGDIVGRLFREFAVTLSVTILLSAFISLTLTPMMCSLLLRQKGEEKHGRIYEASERIFNNTIAFYGRTLKVVLQHQTLTLLITFGTLVATIWLYIVVPKGFFPIQDTGVIMGISDAPESVSFSSMADRQAQAGGGHPERPGRRQPVVVHRRGRNQYHAEQRTFPDQPEAQGRTQRRRDRHHQAAAAGNRRGRGHHALHAAGAGPDGGRPRQPHAVSVQPGGCRSERTGALDQQAGGQAEDTATVARCCNRPAEPGGGGQPPDRPRHRFAPGRDCQRGGQHAVRRIRAAADLDHVHPVEPVPRGAGGRPLVPRRSRFAEEHLRARRQRAGATERHRALRDGQRRIVVEPPGTVSGGDDLLQPGRPLLAGRGGGGDQCRGLGRRDAAQHPGEFQGTARAFEASQANEGWLILAAIITVYIVLGVLYESYIHPVTILSTLPSAGVGAILALNIFRMDLGVMALIGIILLIGIVKKNAIMMIDFALEAERKEGKSPLDAIYEACLLRFRPIMMTTFAALFGAVPLAVGSGTGSELRRPLGVTIIGGLLFSQILTLYTTPVVYLWFDRLGAALRNLRAPKPAEAVGD